MTELTEGRCRSERPLAEITAGCAPALAQTFTINATCGWHDRRRAQLGTREHSPGRNARSYGGLPSHDSRYLVEAIPSRPSSVRRHLDSCRPDYTSQVTERRAIQCVHTVPRVLYSPTIANPPRSARQSPNDDTAAIRDWVQLITFTSELGTLPYWYFSESYREGLIVREERLTMRAHS